MLRSVRRRSVLLALPILALTPVAWADQPGQSGAPGAQPVVVAETPSVGDIFIGEVEKRIISDYYSRHLVAFEQSPDYAEYGKHKNKKNNKHKGLPPGIAKKGTLPPGIAMQLARNHQLPRGLDYQPLPHDLVVQLPAVQRGYRYTIVDNRVLLVQEASNLIIDAIEVAALAVLN
ncbi:MAG TPA: hypothetical protein VGF43_07155 [Dongiaceae bacterium]|jgi:hypothetical protein